MRCLRVVDANQPASRRGEPQPAGVVRIDAGNRTRRQPVAGSEQSKAPVVVACNLAVQANPNVTSAVFTERADLYILGREARQGRQVPELLAGVLPPQERCRRKS